MTIKSFSELRKLKSFEDRFNYLKLHGKVGAELFGFDRIINQRFYQSQEWKSVRNEVIYRDEGFDLGCYGYPISDMVMVHHMNPITIDDLTEFNKDILDPEFLISTSIETHLAIHYGDPKLLPRLSLERKPGDTRLW